MIVPVHLLEVHGVGERLHADRGGHVQLPPVAPEDLDLDRRGRVVAHVHREQVVHDVVLVVRERLGVRPVPCHRRSGVIGARGGLTRRRVEGGELSNP